VTGAGATDELGGWRNDNRAGGILLDLNANEILTRCLSVPHSRHGTTEKCGYSKVGMVDTIRG
jgi:hypothetical protein